jgi:hypothetical protein
MGGCLSIAHAAFTTFMTEHVHASYLWKSGMDVITKKHRIVDHNLGTVINDDVNVSGKLYA